MVNKIVQERGREKTKIKDKNELDGMIENLYGPFNRLRVLNFKWGNCRG